MSLLSAFFISTKWFYNPIFAGAGLDESVFGVLISGMTGISALGAKLSDNFNFNYLLSVAVFTLLLVFLGLSTGNLLLFLPFGLLFFFRGIVETQLRLMLNKKVKDSVRASVISLKNLVMRLLSGGYVAIAGFGVEKIGFGYFFILTAGLMGVLFAFNYFFIKPKEGLELS
jgi:hypothetical protein